MSHKSNVRLIWVKVFSFVFPACPALSNPDDGSVSTVGGDQFLAEADYNCIPGFELSGCSHRSCLSTGLWSGDAPTCVETGREFLETREILISYSKFDQSFFQSTRYRQNEITVYYLIFSSSCFYYVCPVKLR